MRLPMAWMVPLALILVLFFSADLTSASRNARSIGRYVLVGKNQVGNFHHQFAYKAELINDGPDEIPAATACLATLPGIVIRDSQLHFDRAGAHQSVLSTDTFALQWPVDRAIDPTLLDVFLRWKIRTDGAPAADRAGEGFTRGTECGYEHRGGLASYWLGGGDL